MTTRGTVVLLSTVLLIAWIGVATAGLFPHGPNPAVPKTLVDADTLVKEPKQQRGNNDDVRPFRNTWVVEFNDLPTTSPEEFAQQHNVHVRRIGNTNKYSVRQKHDTNGLDVEMQNELSSDPRVRSIEFEIPRQQVLRQIPTTDPGLCQQWHLYQCPTASLNTANINIAPAWEKGYTGVAVQIAIVDDGVETTHPDLAANYIAAVSYDFNFDDSDPSPSSTNAHGTACAGLVAAPSNSQCGVGGAYNAKFSALRLIAAGTTDSQEASALSYRSNKNHIYSNSWGPIDNGVTIAGPGALTRAALSSTTGRDGKGNIFVWAGGNGRDSVDQTGKDGYASHPNVICVAATNANGQFASYSEPGASVFVAAPGGEYDTKIYTTDLSGSNGYSATECTSQFSGTSAATPIVAGAVALILEANPALTNRDVRRIIGLTAAKNDRDNAYWFRNAAYHWVNYNYGFGLIDVDKAVEAAKTWTNLPTLATTSQVSATVNRQIERTLQWEVFNYPDDVTIEYVALTVNVQHTFRGDLTFSLVSPSNTEVIMLFSDDDPNDNIQWTFYSYFFMDEPSLGYWQLNMQDMYEGDVGTLISYSFSVVGRPREDYGTTTVTLANDPVTEYYVAQMLNITVTFSDDWGIFEPSIHPAAIKINDGITPTAVTIASSTSTSVTAIFTIDTTALGPGSYGLRTTELSVQNKRLKYIAPDLLFGDMYLLVVPPVSPPVEAPPLPDPPVGTTEPIADKSPVDVNAPQDGSAPVASSVPVVSKEPITGSVSDATNRAAELAVVVCAIIFAIVA